MLKPPFDLLTPAGRSNPSTSHRLWLVILKTPQTRTDRRWDLDDKTLGTLLTCGPCWHRFDFFHSVRHVKYFLLPFVKRNKKLSLPGFSHTATTTQRLLKQTQKHNITEKASDLRASSLPLFSLCSVKQLWPPSCFSESKDTTRSHRYHCPNVIITDVITDIKYHNQSYASPGKERMVTLRVSAEAADNMVTVEKRKKN